MPNSDQEGHILLYNGCFAPDTLPMELFLRATGIHYSLINDNDLSRFRFLPIHKVFVVPAGHLFDDTPTTAFGGKLGIENLRQAIWNGMNYFGICAGA